MGSESEEEKEKKLRCTDGIGGTFGCTLPWRHAGTCKLPVIDGKRRRGCPPAQASPTPSWGARNNTISMWQHEEGAEDHRASVVAVRPSRAHHRLF